ncbi:MAG TPA: helix-turn-helix domain-containing protein [Gemmatimonadales bacterium]|nr:helix-turn-helix domain-containing protein [Gemmatimonadales bacterium]
MRSTSASAVSDDGYTIAGERARHQRRIDPVSGHLRHPVHASLVAFPDAVLSTLSGIHDVLSAFALRDWPGDRAGTQPPFQVEVVGETAGPLELASGVPINVPRAVDEIETTDVVIVPSVLLRSGAWEKRRYPRLVEWLQRSYDRGAVLCSACSGVFLLAETGLFDGKDATVHFGYAGAFAAAYPAVPIHPERVLVVAGARQELVSSGAASAWHDLVLYLMARYAGATAAQEVARFFALQWHHGGLAPYMVFEGRRDHGDAEIRSAQDWLDTHYSVASPVEEMIKRSRLAGRTFTRRFSHATGLTPLGYVQRLRIEHAKRRLERTDAPIEKIGWQVGYEDPAFFRRLFKRATGLAPGAYRKRFRIPDFARP